MYPYPISIVTFIFLICLIVGLGLDLSRVELDDVFSGRVSKAKGIPLGVEVLTDTFHNLQDQSYLFLKRNKFSECFTDSVMRLVLLFQLQTPDITFHIYTYNHISLPLL